MDTYNNNLEDTMILVVSPKSPETRWVTLDNTNNSIISEGKTPGEAIEKAKEVTDNYALMFVPLEDNTYFF